jgi:hypothetical protein
MFESIICTGDGGADGGIRRVLVYAIVSLELRYVDEQPFAHNN